MLHTGLSFATIASMIIGSLVAYLVTTRLIRRLERSDYILDHDWVDAVEPFLMLLPGAAIGGLIVWIGHAFFPTMETCFVFLITLSVGLISGFIEAAPKVYPDTE